MDVTKRIGEGVSSWLLLGIRQFEWEIGQSGGSEMNGNLNLST